MFCGFYIRQAKKKQAISKAGIRVSRLGLWFWFRGFGIWLWVLGLVLWDLALGLGFRDLAQG